MDQRMRRRDSAGQGAWRFPAIQQKKVEDPTKRMQLGDAVAQ